jgi:hypothetical protein
VVRAYSKSDTGNMEDAIEKQERIDSERDDDISATRFEHRPRLRRAHVQSSDEESSDMALREREREGKIIRASLLFCNPC